MMVVMMSMVTNLRASYDLSHEGLRTLAYEGHNLNLRGSCDLNPCDKPVRVLWLKLMRVL